jgi:hypothetical protein
LGRVAFMGKKEMYTKFSSGSLKEREHSENLGIDGSIILN